jgi:hypothetical protein
MTNKHTTGTHTEKLLASRASQHYSLLDITTTLDKADLAYRTFRDQCVIDPEHIQTHLKPLIDTTEKFLQLTKMLRIGDEDKDADVQVALDALLHERKLAYLEELTRVMDALYDKRYALPTSEIRAFSLDDKGEMNSIKKVAQLSPTASVVTMLGEYRFLAASHHIDDGHKLLNARLAETDKKAAEAERTIGLPKGTLQAFLELDNSLLFSSITNADTERGEHNHLADLVNEQTFKIRFAKVVAKYADFVFDAQSAALNKTPTRGGSTRLQ